MEEQRYFKYTQKEFADKMFETGQIKLGTLYEYRDHKDPAIRDPDEEKATFNFLINTDRFNYQDEDHSFLRPSQNPYFDLKVGENSSFRMTNVSFQHFSEVVNCYMYCLTKDATKENMIDCGYDTCVEILDSRSFAWKILNELHNAGLNKFLPFPYMHRDCIYYEEGKERHTSANFAFKACFLKYNRDAYQSEHRIIFPSVDKTEKLLPVILNLPDLKDIIRLEPF
jgi:hypothetical protein